MALVTQHVVNICHEDEANMVLATEGTPMVATRWSASVISECVATHLKEG